MWPHTQPSETLATLGMVVNHSASKGSRLFITHHQTELNCRELLQFGTGLWAIRGTRGHHNNQHMSATLCTLYTVHCHCTLCTIHGTLQNVYCTLRNILHGGGIGRGGGGMGMGGGGDPSLLPLWCSISKMDRVSIGQKKKFDT